MRRFLAASTALLVALSVSVRAQWQGVTPPAGDTQKIDSRATDGLAGVHNSLAYRVHEIEKHLHSAGSWFELAASPSGETNRADRIGEGSGPMVADAGNDDWGSWVQILGSDDTPARAGSVSFDPHEIVFAYTEKATTYFVQIARGDSGAAGLAAGTYTELVFASDKAGARAATITETQTGRAPAGSKLWVRVKCPGQNTSELRFYLGIHEYAG